MYVLYEVIRVRASSAIESEPTAAPDGVMLKQTAR